MSAQYHVDLGKFSLEKFKHDLSSRVLTPSRMSLKDDLDERFKLLETSGITNMKELVDALKTKPKIELFSQETGLSAEYLTLLNREAKSYLPNPVRLDKFPGIPEKFVHRLEAVGITNSRHLFNKAGNKKGRAQLSQTAEVPVEILDDLVCLSDLSRTYGVGPVFARMVYDVGVKTIRDFIQYTAEDLVKIYEEVVQRKADFGVHEIQFSIDLAKELDIAVEL
jgi:nucleotidyltransferase/DNA polymerase involved in DNA repair